MECYINDLSINKAFNAYAKKRVSVKQKKVPESALRTNHNLDWWYIERDSEKRANVRKSTNEDKLKTNTDWHLIEIDKSVGLLDSKK